MVAGLLYGFLPSGVERGVRMLGRQSLLLRSWKMPDEKVGRPLELSHTWVSVPSPSSMGFPYNAGQTRTDSDLRGPKEQGWGLNVWCSK